MTVSLELEDRVEIFARNSTPSRQEKQKPTIPEIGLSMNKIVFKHDRTIRHILDVIKVNKADRTSGISPLILKKCASEQVYVSSMQAVFPLMKFFQKYG